MATVRLKNRTQFQLAIPRPLNLKLKPGGVRDVEVIDVDRTFNDPRIQALIAKKHVSMDLVQDDTPDIGSILPFYTAAARPAATANPGMLLYNTSDDMVEFSDGDQWLALERIPTYAGGLPAPASVPASYLVFDKDNQTLWINSGSQWMLTMASGVEARPSHQFPVASTVPVGTLMFDTDNGQLKLSDGTSWQLTNNVNDYSQPTNLPALGSVGFGALAYTSRDGTLWFRYGSEWLPTTGLVRFYATYGDLPTNATWGNDERGAIAYINDDRTFVVWEGKKWRYLMQPEHYTTATLPSASGYGTGYMVFNEDHNQHLCQVGGRWDGIQGVSRSYIVGLRPANTDVPEGTCIWNTTTNQANWNIGGSWVNATGIVDP